MLVILEALRGKVKYAGLPRVKCVLDDARPNSPRMWLESCVWGNKLPGIG